jgi:hypothetical protein
MNNETQWVEENCACGISEKTNEWSEHVFDLFGCNCKSDEEDDES